MRISDWSSDVCSSDLAGDARCPDGFERLIGHGQPWCRDAVSPALCVPFERQSCGDRTIGERREIAELDHQRVAVPTGFARGCSVEPLLRASSPRLDLDETGMF